MAAVAVSPALVAAAPSTPAVSHARNTEVQNVRIEHARQLPSVPGLPSNLLSAASAKHKSDDDDHPHKAAVKQNNNRVPSMEEPDKLDDSDVVDKEIAKYDPEAADEIPGDGAGGTPMRKNTPPKSSSTTTNAAAPSQDYSADTPRPGDSVTSAATKRSIA